MGQGVGGAGFGMGGCRGMGRAGGMGKGMGRGGGMGRGMGMPSTGPAAGLPENAGLQECRCIYSVDNELCNGCGKCGQRCQYSAIICLKDKPLVFGQLCHSCGGCMLVCLTDVIKDKLKEVGFADL